MKLPEIRKPYLLFLGDMPDPLDAKTGYGIADWRREWCVGQYRMAGCGGDTGLPDMSIAEAEQAGAGTLIIGVAPAGGRLPSSWEAIMVEALSRGLDIASGLHSRLNDIPVIAEAAKKTGRQIFDVRHPTQDFPCGVGDKRPGKRLLAVGTDTCSGKMYSTLSIEKEMKSRGMNADFRATGQTGIFIAGGGVSVDAVIADFISGATELLSPANDPAHWDVIEGQGSLFHPSYAGVSLGLLHGSQPDVLVLCHEAGRTHIDGMAQWSLPSLEECMELNLTAARLTNPDVKFVGICMNTSKYEEAEALALMAETGIRLGLPCVDPFRIGVGAIVDRLEQ